MTKVEKLLKSITAIVKAENDDLAEQLKDFPNADLLVKHIEDFETKVAKLLKTQRDYYVAALESDVTKAEDDSARLADFINYKMQDIFAADEFAKTMNEESAAFLYLTVPELTTAIMDAIDPDILFVELSKVATDWIDTWAPQLGELMQITSHDAVEKAFKETLNNGDGIEKAVLKLKGLPEFDRKRARTTAITEILTASSVAQQEAYTQSPAVVGKTWLHSGGKKNNPRPAHVELSNTTVNKDATFEVNGYQALYPRDVTLPASERVHCHCTTVPSVDEAILGLSKDEKEKIRQQVLDDLNA